MKPENQRALVDEINKKTVEGKLKWDIVVNAPGSQAKFAHPEAHADYYYYSELDDSTLYLYELALPRQIERAPESTPTFMSILDRYSPSKSLNLYLAVRDQEGVTELVLKGNRLLGDLMRSVGAKAGTPDSVAEDLIGRLRQL